MHSEIMSTSSVCVVSLVWSKLVSSMVCHRAKMVAKPEGMRESWVGTFSGLLLNPTHVEVPKEQRLARGLNDGLVRLSVGIEHKDDIIADLDRALEKV